MVFDPREEGEEKIRQVGENIVGDMFAESKDASGKNPDRISG